MQAAAAESTTAARFSGCFQPPAPTRRKGNLWDASDSSGEEPSEAEPSVKEPEMGDEPSTNKESLDACESEPESE